MAPQHRGLGLVLFPVLIACSAADPAADAGDQSLPDRASSDRSQPDRGLPDRLPGKLDTVDPCAGYLDGPLEGDDLLVLVNKADGQQLRRDWAPSDLVSIPAAQMVPNGQGMLRPAALQALQAMLAGSGVDLRARSAYRSFEEQCIAFSKSVAQNGLDYTLRYYAEPGRSQHQLGTTVDVSCAAVGWVDSISLGSRPEGLWLADNAKLFGFALSYPKGQEQVTGYAYEPWHFRYIGVPAATEMAAKGMTLEPYLQACQNGSTDLVCPRQ